MKKIILLLINIMFIFLSTQTAFAVCSATRISTINTTVSPVTQSVTFGPVVAQKNVPVGTILATVYTSDTGQYYVDCIGTGYLYFNLSYGGGVKSNVEHTYKTNVPGVGLMVIYNEWSSRPYYENPRTSKSYDGGKHFSTGNVTSVSLIATGPISPGVINSGEIGYITVDGSGNTKAYTLLLGAGINVSSSSCSLNTSNINIKLDDISDAELVSVGTTAKLKNFDIGLDCQANARVNVKLTGTQNPDTTAVGVLKLTNAGSTGVAKGVGIQMLYDNKPMTVNQNVLLKTSAGGLETFTFGAQYYQTKAAVSGGSANATATLDITYQ